MSPAALTRLHLALIAGIGFAAFSPTLACGFTNWDDETFIVENPYYRGLSPEHLKWMFTTFLAGHYQPLAWITMGVDYLIWGMNPAGYHLTSVLVHVVASLVLYGVLLEFLRPAGADGEARLRWAAAAATLFYAVHPLRVESVAWVTERRDVLCGLFFLLTVFCHLKASRRRMAGEPWIRWHLAAAGCFAASLLSKSLGIMLPFVLLALDVRPLGRWAPGHRRKVLLEKVPFLLLSAADGLIMVFAMSEIRAFHAPARYVLIDRIMQAAYGLCFYVSKSLLPVNLSPLYPIDTPMNPWEGRFVLSLVAVLLTGILLLRLRRGFPGMVVAVFSYAVLLLPVLGLFVTGRQLVADRYSYLACLPGSVLLGALILRAAPRFPVRRLAAAAAAAILVLGVLTFRQTWFWKDSITLWTRALDMDARNAVAWSNRGVARSIEGDLQGGLADLNRALEINRTNGNVFRNRGVTRWRLKDLDGAWQDFEEAIRLEPKNSRTYALRAEIRRLRGDLEGAASDLSLAVEYDPWDINAVIRRGGVRTELGNVEGAMADFERALRAGPPTAPLLAGRASAFIRRGNPAQAFLDAAEAIRIDPLYAPAYVNRGVARRASGDLDGAIQDFGLAISLDPTIPAVFTNRAIARSAKGDLEGAIEDCTAALRISPGFATAYFNRGVLRHDKGDKVGAIEDFSEAVRLNPRLAMGFYERARLRKELGLEGVQADLEAARDLMRPGPDRNRVLQMLEEEKGKPR